MNKKIVFLLVALLSLSLLITGCGAKETPAPAENGAETADQSLQEIKDNGKLVLGLDDSFPPMGYRDESGEVVGFDIDLAKEVAKRMGVELVTQPIEWDSNILTLNKKDIDVIWNGLSVTEERKEAVSFSKPYLENRQIIIVNADADISKKADLAGKIVGVQMGSSGEYALTADEETAKSLKDMVKFENFPQALLDLKAGRIDAVVIDEIVGKYYMAKKPGDYKAAEDDFGRESYAVGFRKNDLAFRDEADKILDEMRADGTAAEISKKWFGEDIVAK